MNKKGISAILSAIILVFLGVILSAIIASLSRNTLNSLSPSANCDSVNFDAEIINMQLGVQNNGNIQLEGFILKEKTADSIENLGEVNLVVPPGNTKSAQIEFNIQQGIEVYVIPKIYRESMQGEIISPCRDEFGMLVTAE